MMQKKMDETRKERCTRQEWQAQRRDKRSKQHATYRLLKIVGQGTFGRVYLVVFRVSVGLRPSGRDCRSQDDPKRRKVQDTRGGAHVEHQRQQHCTHAGLLHRGERQGKQRTHLGALHKHRNGVHAGKSFIRFSPTPQTEDSAE